jgi:sugar phosphate isomerase/epimerase
MEEQKFDRREVLKTSAILAGASLAAPMIFRSRATAAEKGKPMATFHYCFNTSTIRGQNLNVPQQIDVAAKAGYDGIELWLGDLHKFVEGGGSLDDLRKQLGDSGLTLESAIGFARWIVDDDEQRKAGLDDANRDMDVLAQIGGKRIAAPPAGAGEPIELMKIAERYRALLEVGDQTGIVPQVECWGPSKVISRLSQTAFIAVESGHPKACILPDVYHLFRGGSDFNGLKLLDGRAIQVFHVNDYPESPPREQMNDSHRVYPGDGVAPLDAIFADLAANGFNGHLSLELFNREYWEQDPLEVARTGLEKTRAAVAKALEKS